MLTLALNSQKIELQQKTQPETIQEQEQASQSDGLVRSHVWRENWLQIAIPPVKSEFEIQEQRQPQNSLKVQSTSGR